MQDIIKMIADNDGSIAIDILSDKEIKAAKEAERFGLIKWESGSWGDSDYYLLTEKGRARLQCLHHHGRAAPHISGDDVDHDPASVMK